MKKQPAEWDSVIQEAINNICKRFAEINEELKEEEAKQSVAKDNVIQEAINKICKRVAEIDEELKEEAAEEEAILEKELRDRAVIKLTGLYWLIDSLFKIGGDGERGVSGLQGEQLTAIGMDLERIIDDILVDLGENEINAG